MAAIQTELPPRFVPRTLSGKKQELPIKKLLLGQPLDKVFDREAMANPECLAWYEALANTRQTGSAQPPAGTPLA